MPRLPNHMTRTYKYNVTVISYINNKKKNIKLVINNEGLCQTSYLNKKVHTYLIYASKMSPYLATFSLCPHHIRGYG